MLMKEYIHIRLWPVRAISLCWAELVWQWKHVCRVTSCLENLEMSGNLKPVRELSGYKPCHGKEYQKLVVAS